MDSVHFHTLFVYRPAMPADYDRQIDTLNRPISSAQEQLKNLDAYKNLGIDRIKEYYIARENKKYGIIAPVPEEVEKLRKELSLPLSQLNTTPLEAGSYSIYLQHSGPDKINVLKEVKEITNLALKEAKELVDSAPVTIVRNISRTDAEAIESRLRALGAWVEIDKVE